MALRFDPDCNGPCACGMPRKQPRHAFCVTVEGPSLETDSECIYQGVLPLAAVFKDEESEESRCTAELPNSFMVRLAIKIEPRLPCHEADLLESLS